jgi:hypothetical protein
MQNNSVILWCSVLLVEETGVTGVYDWPTGICRKIALIFKMNFIQLYLDYSFSYLMSK